jgi:hypothetical protein
MSEPIVHLTVSHSCALRRFTQLVPCRWVLAFCHDLPLAEDQPRTWLRDTLGHHPNSTADQLDTLFPVPAIELFFGSGQKKHTLYSANSHVQTHSVR